MNLYIRNNNLELHHLFVGWLNNVLKRRVTGLLIDNEKIDKSFLEVALVVAVVELHLNINDMIFNKE